MRNRQISTVPSRCLALGLALGLSVPLQALVAAGALADTANPVAVIPHSNVVPAPTYPCELGLTDRGCVLARRQRVTVPTSSIWLDTSYTCIGRCHRTAPG